MKVLFFGICGRNLMKFWYTVGDASHSNAAPRLSISCFIRKTLIACRYLSCEVVEKTSKIGSLWALDFFFGIAEILDIRFQTSLTFEHVAGFG